MSVEAEDEDVRVQTEEHEERALQKWSNQISVTSFEDMIFKTQNRLTQADVNAPILVSWTQPQIYSIRYVYCYYKTHSLCKYHRF